MPVDTVVRYYIENNLLRNMSDASFENEVDVMFNDALALLAGSPGDCLHTMAYLSYRISEQLMRSTNHQAQAGYAACMTRLLQRWYSDQAVLQPLQGAAVVHCLGVMTRLYQLHYTLIMNGLRSQEGPYLLDSGEALRVLQQGVMATLGPWQAHIHLHGRIRDYYHVRLNLAPGPTAQIQVGRSGHDELTIQVATWNMQGVSEATDTKWRTGVLPLLRGHDVVVLQEAGTPPRSAVLQTSEQVDDQFGVSRQVDVYTWQAGTQSRPEHYRIYYFNVHRMRVSLAIVMPDPGAFTVNQVAVVSDGLAIGGSGVPAYRPALGVRLRRRTSAGITPEVSVFNLHAISNGGVNAARVLREISWHTDTPFVLLGDFNRDPREAVPPDPARGNWVSPEDIARIELAVDNTHPSEAPRNMLDYAVTNGTSRQPAPGRVAVAGASDHRAVNYTLSFNC